MIINGSLAPILRATDVDFDPVRGLVVVEEWHGPGANCLLGKANWAINNRVGFRWKRAGISTMTLTYSGGQNGLSDIAQTNYELLGNEIQKSIYESGIALAGLAAWPNLIRDVKLGWNAIESGEPETEQALYDSMAADEKTYYDTLIGFLMRGQTHFAQGQYVLKRSISVSNFYTGSAGGEGNVERLVSTGTLLGWCSDMPPFIAAKINTIPGGSAHTNYAWSWRQLPSRIVTGAQNRCELSTEWWFEEWSTLLYGSVL